MLILAQIGTILAVSVKSQLSQINVEYNVIHVMFEFTLAA